ncbi:MAG: synthetase [Betaproteobacteria bacterium]|nr:synthetase [Betaproteobacteria bacterium]
MKIAIAQINCTVGDLGGNAARILDFVERARAESADVIITPELALCGYPPEDLLLRDDFYRSCAGALAELAGRIKGITAVVGHPHQVGTRRYNAASVIQDGRIVATYHKHALPNDTVFDEERYFEAGNEPCVFAIDGVPLGVNICEDTWDSFAPRAACAAGARLLLVLNASPYHLRKQHTRYDVMRERVAENGVPLIYANMVGGQDELVFDGASFVLDRNGKVTHQLPIFKEALAFVTVENGAPVAGEIVAERAVEADVYDALCLGVRDYVTKNGFPGVLLGLSGGIDSALTVAIAADALGAGKVHAVMMPSQYTANMSRDDALAEAQALGVRYSEIAIKPTYDAFADALAKQFEGLKPDTTEENLQSRIRGTLLMALSNKTGAIVLTTGNKSEMGTGYATLYGDMAGGFAVLKDISKMLVYRLSNYRNSLSPVIPQRVITRAPSAELRADQTDQDSLPPYDVLDAIMEAYVEHDQGLREIEAQGYSRKDIERVIQLVRISEYKRRQAPIGIRITPRGFGKDWRYPVTNKYRHQFE